MRRQVSSYHWCTQVINLHRLLGLFLHRLSPAVPPLATFEASGTCRRDRVDIDASWIPWGDYPTVISTSMF